jgi:23S rRNA-/tRNA-specific pseudouridylate synthase
MSLFCGCPGGPGVHHSIGKLLEPLARKIDRSGKLSTLHLVHRLDKETTGVMVLAKYVGFLCSVAVIF